MCAGDQCAHAIVIDQQASPNKDQDHHQQLQTLDRQLS